MFGPRMEVVTERVRILMRPFTKEEMAVAADGMQNYTVLRYLGVHARHAQTLETEEAWYARLLEDQNSWNWAICIWENDAWSQPIGNTSFSVLDRRGNSGFVIWDPSYWNKGVADAAHLGYTLYAFKELDLLAIDSSAMQVNHGSCRALLRGGYCLRGVYPHVRVVGGRVIHAQEFTLVNPSARAWNYFWGSSKPPLEYVEARKLAKAAMKRAQQCVRYV